MYKRKKTIEVNIGGVKIGGDNPVVIQSMTNTRTSDADGTVDQINSLVGAGCEIVRVAVPDIEAAEQISNIKERISVPLVADVHFDYRLALSAIRNGADKLRINPGNIGDAEKIRQIAQEAKKYRIPIRVGANAGSLSKEILALHNGVTAVGLCESALKQIEMLERFDFHDIVVAVKASSVPMTIEAYDLLADKVSYPLHVGITEAGTYAGGSIKSAVGIGSVLSRGIGDTIRVSLTDAPEREVECAKDILRALGLRRFGVELVSCPTCGRTEIDLIGIAREVERRCRNINRNLTIAVMGCVVNGPGEAREADIGIAGGKGCGLIFKKGEIIHKLPESELLDALMLEIEKG